MRRAERVVHVEVEARRERAENWLGLLDRCLEAAGGLGGTDTPTETPIQRDYSSKPYRYDPVPKRDERFPDPFNMAVNAEVFLYDQKFPPEAKTLMMFYKRLREVDVPEMMASIIVQTRGKPWEYYRDMSRQLSTSIAALSAIENDRAVLDLERLVAISEVLGVRPDALFPRSCSCHYYVQRRALLDRVPPVTLKIRNAHSTPPTYHNVLRPLAGAQGSVPGTGRGSLANDEGRYLLPGLWDVHVHLEWPRLPEASVAELTLAYASNAHEALTEAGSHGVKVLEPSDDMKASVAIFAAENAAKLAVETGTKLASADPDQILAGKLLGLGAAGLLLPVGGAIVQEAKLHLNLVDTDASPDATYSIPVHKIVVKNPAIAAATWSSSTPTS